MQSKHIYQPKNSDLFRATAKKNSTLNIFQQSFKHFASRLIPHDLRAAINIKKPFDLLMWNELLPEPLPSTRLPLTVSSDLYPHKVKVRFLPHQGSSVLAAIVPVFTPFHKRFYYCNLGFLFQQKRRLGRAFFIRYLYLLVAFYGDSFGLR